MKKVMIAATLLLALTAHAEFKDGNKLLSQMQKEYAGNDWFNAIGYVTGVVDAHNGNLFCAPATSTAAQLFDMTKQYLSENPAVRHMPADLLIAVALSKPWPCKKGSSS